MNSRNALLVATIRIFFILGLLALSGCTESNLEPMSPEEFGHIELYRPQGTRLKASSCCSPVMPAGIARWRISRIKSWSWTIWSPASIRATTFADRRPKPKGAANPGLDLAALGQHLQNSPGSSAPKPPILVGVSSGGSLAYAAVAQAPAQTFHAAVSLDFVLHSLQNNDSARGKAWRPRPVPTARRRCLRLASNCRHRGSSFKTHTIAAATWRARTGLSDRSITSIWSWRQPSPRIYANNSWH